MGMKEKTKARKGITDPRVGDAYCFVAFERHSKLALCWHLGRRTDPHTDLFMKKLDRATDGHFQLSADGMQSYPEAASYHLGMRTDFAQLIKEYGTPEGTEEQRRYSSLWIILAEKISVYGNLDEARICTSHVERQNLTICMALCRFTWLTNAFSKKWENLRAALALFFCWYNFCWMHSSIRMTPAMKADLARKPWSIRELVAAAAGV